MGKQKARKSLFKSCQAPRRVEPSEDAFSTEAWCPNARFLLLVWLIFFSNMARKVVDFQGLLLGTFFMPVFFWGRLLDVCSQSIHFWAQKYGLQVEAKKNSDFFGNLELWNSSMNLLSLLSVASAKNAARSVTIKKNEVKEQADMRPHRRSGYSIRLVCVWASRRQESPCSSLIRHRTAPGLE